MAIKVGITGGMGSGKSTVCKIFKLLGAPVFEADVVAKQLLNTHPKIKKGLIRLFGEGIYMQDGAIDRKKLAGIIFNNKIQLANMNRLVHPVVLDEFNKWLEKQQDAYIIHEAAILFESGFYKMMDFTLLISAPLQQRIERVMKRDGVGEQQVLERINRQWTDEEKRKLASLEIINDNKHLIIPVIIEIDKKLKQYGKIW
ncbi:MAG: dephospho-CoA kinase [Prolixibacteraceae bacterium]|nr:dephospho-CoA kinase [Prolixibacteraceae bacterium]